MILATTIVIPGFQVPSQNVTERRHWSARAKERRRLNWLLVGALPQRGCPHGGRKRGVEVIAYRTRRIRDKANLVGGCKTLIDALVGAGVLVDDSEQWLDASYRQDLHRAAGYDQPTTVIRIYDLEGA